MPLATAENLDKSSTTLAKALQEVVKGEVLADPFTRSMYATDASIYEIEPVLVVYPKDELDVRSCLWFGQKHGVAVIARGAGSGVAGESLGKAIIMDLSIHLKNIIELDKNLKQVTVQAGVVLDSLNRALRPHGFRFGPNPGSSNRCTLGGMIANNASGPHSLKYGDTRQSLVAARVCLMDGTVTLANPLKLSSSEYEQKKKEEGLSGKIHRELPELMKKHAALIASKQLKTRRNRAGYALQDVVNGEVYDLAKLIAGSEGTLGVVTQAVLKLEPLSGRIGMAVLYFGSIFDAAKATPAILETNPIACELFDEKLIKLSRGAAPELAHLLPEDASTMLVVEYEGVDEADVRGQVRRLEDSLKGAAQSIKVVLEPYEQAAVWAVRREAVPLLFKRTDGTQPVPIVEDGCVPPESLAAYLEKAIAVFDKYGLDWTAYAHAGHGAVHLRPYMDLRTAAHYDILEKVASEVHAVVWECGGTISGEHGEGLVRSQFLEKQVGKELYAVYKEVKALFDPSLLLNPNKKITNDAHLMLRDLRFGPGYEFSTGERPKAWSIDKNQAVNHRMFKSQTSIRPEMTVEAIAPSSTDIKYHGGSPLKWQGREMADETERCNGCGHCRTTGHDEDMCPRFKFERIEDASPRAKANVLRRLMTGRQREGSFSNDEVIEIMDTCFNCKLCIQGCPSNVNIPKIVQEAKARYYQSHGIPFHKRLAMRAETFMRLFQWMRPLVNWKLQNPIARFFMEKLIGIDSRRDLPLLKRWRLRRRFTPSAHSARPKVVLYLDLYAKYCAPELAQAAVDVLEHNGFEVEVPDAPWTNMPALSEGAVLEARKQVNAVAKVLAPYAFKGHPILAIDGSSCLALRSEFLSYVDTPETRAVARHTYDIAEFLVDLHKQKRLKTDFRRTETTVGYHQGCHHKALNIGTPAISLLRLVPGARVVHIDHGCCGNPNGFGMTTKNYEESMWIGREIFRDMSESRYRIQYAATECANCKLQIEHGAEKETIHPIQVLARAYGYAAARPDDGLEPVVIEKKDEHVDPNKVTVIDVPKPAAHGHAHEHGHATSHH